MTTGTKFQQFIEDLHNGVHDFSSDTIEVALSNDAPSASADAVLADLTSEISYTFCSARTLTLSSQGQTSGTYIAVYNDLTLTASGGSIGPFQYVIFFNQTATNDPLIAFYNTGSAVTVTDGNTYLIDQLGNLITGA